MSAALLMSIENHACSNLQCIYGWGTRTLSAAREAPAVVCSQAYVTIVFANTFNDAGKRSSHIEFVVSAARGPNDVRTSASVALENDNSFHLSTATLRSIRWS